MGITGPPRGHGNPAWTPLRRGRSERHRVQVGETYTLRNNNLWLGLFIYASIFALGHMRHGSIDAIQRLHLTRAMIFDQSVITQKYGPLKYSPLQSAVMIPPYLLGYVMGHTLGYQEEQAHQVGYRLCAFLYSPLAVTGMSVLYFNILLSWKFTLWVALLSTYMLLFGTLVLPYSRIMFSETLSALLIMTSIYGLLRSSQENYSKNMGLAFISLGLLGLNNMAFLFFYLAFFVYSLQACYRANAIQELRIVSIFGLSGMVMMLGAWGIYNYARYGSPFSLGYTGEGFTNQLLIGFYGLLFSIGRGVIFYSPLTAIAFIYFLLNYHHLEKRHYDVLGMYWLASFSILLIFSKWHSFEGGWTWGPRFFLPFVPIIHLMFPFIINKYHGYNIATKWLLTGVCIYALLINMYEFAGAWKQYEVTTFKTGDVPYQLSIYFPEYSVLFNNWDWKTLLRRFPQFIIVAFLSFYAIVFLYPRYCFRHKASREPSPLIAAIT
jgi:hypothetical protein